jgi:hypothetical protein
MPVPKSPSPTRTPRVALIAATAPSAAQHALQEFLQSDPGVIWLGAIAIDADTIRSLSESRPSVVVADLRVAGEIDVDAVFRALFAATPGTQIVAICAAGDEAGARRAPRARGRRGGLPHSSQRSARRLARDPRSGARPHASQPHRPARDARHPRPERDEIDATLVQCFAVRRHYCERICVTGRARRRGIAALWGGGATPPGAQGHRG